VPAHFERYYEPFLGGGALFFKLAPRQATLGDILHELIEVYQVVRDDIDALLTELKQHRYEEEYYYEVRSADRTPEFKNWTPVARAARILFLNKSCFNGLYRVNSKGEFNVPFGRYSVPKLVDEENLRNCSERLQNVKLRCDNYQATLAGVSKGDFVYFDPPYAPLSKTAQFTSYAAGGFTENDQEQLSALCRTLDREGVKFMLTNSFTNRTLARYKRFNLEVVKASRSINSKSDKRGHVSEIIVRNYD